MDFKGFAFDRVRGEALAFLLLHKKAAFSDCLVVRGVQGLTARQNMHKIDASAWSSRRPAGC